MDRRSDLIRDSKLDTRSDSGFTVHTYREVLTSSERRVVQRQEYWRRESRIGMGAYSCVWLEKCVHGYRDVELRAVKEVSTKPLRSGRQIEYSRELEAIAKFSHDKYVHCFVKSFGWYEGEEALFIAMEYLPPGDLDQYLSRASPLSEEAAGDVTYQIIEGLSYMHDNGFAHRDLKPGNILIKSCPPQQWWVKIGDFGISKRLEDETAKSTLLKGTLGFIAPELHELTEAGTPFAADMWSLGEISFQLMTKQPVFKSFGLLARYARENHPFPSTDLLAHNVSNSGQNFISSLMEPAPEKRLTAEQALKHQWMKQYLLLTIQQPLPPQSMTIISATDSITEAFTAWASISSSPQLATTNTLLPNKNRDREQAQGPNLKRSSSEQVQGQVKTQRKVTYNLGRLDGHSGGVYRVVFSPDGTTIASGSWGDRSVRLWDAATGRQLRQLDGHGGSVYSVVFSPDGTTIASGSVDCSVRLWDAATGRQLRQLDGHSNGVYSVVFSPDGTTIASSSEDHSVRIWDAATGRQLRQLGHSENVYSVVFSPDGTTIASGPWNHSVRLWDAATGRQLRQLDGHSKGVLSVVFSPDGTTIASGSWGDHSVRLWDAATGRQLRQLDGHGKGVYSVVFSPDGTTIASGLGDHSIRLWDTATGRQLRQLDGHGGVVYSVVFSPDGTTIASGSRDHSVRLWDAAVQY